MNAISNCGTCANGVPAKFGFLNCRYRAEWIKYAPNTRCAFNPTRWEALNARDKARRAAQAGIAQAAESADRKVNGWTDLAFEFVKLYAMQNKGKRFTGRDIVLASKAKGIIQPENDKAWGEPIRRAATGGIIKRAGFAEDPNRHGNPVPLWEA